MQIHSDSFNNGQPIPGRCAFGVPDAENHVSLSENLNPHLAWSDLPAGTRSLVLLCIDVDVPTRPDDVNQEGRTVPADLPRTDFCHWAMVDIAPAIDSIAEGSCSNGVTPGGKSDPAGPAGARQGINNYSEWFAGDADMGGDYYGYDGPCPPWNDSIVHHYEFRLYATDLERCPVDDGFRAEDVQDAIAGHILDEARLTGTYSLNPDVPA